jgi:hypothetical protein
MSTERKKPINSKAKGSEFERKVAKALSTWWGEQFQRTPMSGGLHWKDDNRVAGDIVTPPDSIYPWTTECKKREGWDLEQVLKGTGEVEKWWSQSVRDGERVSLRPLLVFSKNFAPNYLMMTLDDFVAITIAKQNRMAFNFFIIAVLGKESRVVCNFDDFIKHVSKEDIIKAFNLGGM